MSTFVLLTITGFGLGAMYFLVASGLSLIYGLMGVLNFAHGSFLAVGAYAMWFTESRLGGVAVLPRFLIGTLAGLAVGAVFAGLVELFLIRPLYRRPVEQVLVTVGLALALNAFLRRTRYGLIIRAGVENRAMVTALGIDVRRAFTLVFAIGGVAAAIAGVLSNVYFSTTDPQRGTSLLIFAFIVVVIGGLGSLRGTAIAAVVVGLVQQYANYYASSGLGDLSVVLLLGLVLLARPSGLSGSFA